MHGLPEEQREVILLHIWGQMSFEEWRRSARHFSQHGRVAVSIRTFEIAGNCFNPQRGAGMDRQNDEFEAFLKQFQLRTPGPLPKEGTVPSPQLRRRPRFSGFVGPLQLQRVLALSMRDAPQTQVATAYTPIRPASKLRTRNGAFFGSGPGVRNWNCFRNASNSSFCDPYLLLAVG